MHQLPAYSTENTLDETSEQDNSEQDQELQTSTEQDNQHKTSHDDQPTSRDSSGIIINAKQTTTTTTPRTSQSVKVINDKIVGKNRVVRGSYDVVLATSEHKLYPSSSLGRSERALESRDILKKRAATNDNNNNHETRASSATTTTTTARIASSKASTPIIQG